MKTGELIKLLEKYPPDTLIIKRSDNFELNGALVDVGYVSTTRVEKREEEFVDAFDYTHYHSEVYRHVFNNEKEFIEVVVLND